MPNPNRPFKTKIKCRVCGKYTTHIEGLCMEPEHIQKVKDGMVSREGHTNLNSVQGNATRIANKIQTLILKTFPGTTDHKIILITNAISKMLKEELRDIKRNPEKYFDAGVKEYESRNEYND